MKLPEPVMLGLGLIAAVCAFAAVIHARNHVESPKLCVRVMSELMAKKNKSTADMYMREHADLLQVNGATDEKLNEAWENWITQFYAKDHSQAEGVQWMENFRKRWDCT